MIKPTIGRKVWYRPSLYEIRKQGDHSPESAHKLVCHYMPTPMDATVVYVWNDRMVNLRVTDHDGNQCALTSVLLLQGDETYTTVNGYCEWMPYQAGQAAKARAEEINAHAHTGAAGASTTGFPDNAP